MSQKTIRKLASRDEIVMEPVRQLYDYWLSLKDKDALPDASLFDVLDVPDLVPNLARITLAPGESDWKVRFHGQDSVVLVGLDATGHSNEVADESDFGRRSVELFRLVLDTRSPVINGPADLQVKGKQHLTIQSLAVPFVTDGQICEIIAVMSIEGVDEDDEAGEFGGEGDTDTSEQV